jgi:signal transduction histidine kinase
VLRELELAWEGEDLFGVVRSNGTTLFSSLPPGLLEDILPLSRREGLFRMYHGLNYINGFTHHFPVWGWEVITVSPPVPVTQRNSIVFFMIPTVVLAGGLLTWGVLLILQSNLQRPMRGLLSGIASGRVEPTGVSEMDRIGNAINDAFSSLATRNDQLRTLHDVAISIPRVASLDDFLVSLLEKGMRIMAAAHAGIWIFGPDQGEPRRFFKAGSCCPLAEAQPGCAAAMQRLCRGGITPRSPKGAGPAEIKAALGGCSAGIFNYLSRSVASPKGPAEMLLFFGNKEGGFTDEDEVFVNALAADAVAAFDRFHDEEALRRAMRDLEDQNNRLRALDRMKDGLIRDVTHELKTPVAKHSMQLELLREALGESCRERVGNILRIMEQSVERQQLVIRNLLDLSRLEAGGRKYVIKPVGLDGVIGKVLEDYRSSLESGDTAFSTSGSGLTVAADEEMLWHAFSNLVNNAIKFRRRDARAVIEIRAARDGADAVVTFHDNGRGLTPEQLGRVFERFYQASASDEGSGVGLSICKAIVEDMGGQIRMESEGPDKGATVVVHLPLA